MKRTKYFIMFLGIFFLFFFYAQLYADWSPEKRISEPDVSWYPQIVAQGDILHVVYTNWESGDKISYVRSTDYGPILPVNEPLTLIDDHNSYWSSIAVNEHGHLAFCWVDFRYSQYFAQGDLFIRFSNRG